MDNIEKIDLNQIDWKSSKDFFESLRNELEKIEGDSHNESYNFTWVGKRKSIAEAGRPINKTLRPTAEASKDFDATGNILIIGDNLDALKLLQSAYLGQVKMIYIDPPYNTGHDFIYRDNFTSKKSEYEDESIDEDGDVVTSEDPMQENSKSSGRFHSDWLNMMYPRLKLARNLLSDDGVIFISIDDNEQANLKKLCDEVFGEENFLANLKAELSLTQGMKVGAAQNGTIVKNGELIVSYAKNGGTFQLSNLLYDGVAGYDKHFCLYMEEQDDDIKVVHLENFLQSEHFDIDDFFIKKNKKKNFPNFCKLMSEDEDFKQLVYMRYAKNICRSMMASIKVPSDVGERLDNGFTVRFDKYILRSVGKNKTVEQLLPLSSTIGLTDDFNPVYGRRRIRGDMWKGFYADMMNVAKEGGVDFKNGKKPVRLIKQLVKWGSPSNSLILDFFAGSGTTGHAVMDLNAEDGGHRKYILVQWPEETNEKSEARKAGYETIDQITADRLRRAGEKIQKDHPDAQIDTGFRVFRIDSTNENDGVRKTPADTDQAELFDSVDNLKPDRMPLDLLFGIILFSGMPFDKKLATENINGNTVYYYGYFGEGSGIIACFDENIPEDTIETIAKKQPLLAAFRDSSFMDSSAKVNLSGQFRVISPETRVKVL